MLSTLQIKLFSSETAGFGGRVYIKLYSCCQIVFWKHWISISLHSKHVNIFFLTYQLWMLSSDLSFLNLQKIFLLTNKFKKWHLMFGSAIKHVLKWRFKSKLPFWYGRVDIGILVFCNLKFHLFIYFLKMKKFGFLPPNIRLEWFSSYLKEFLW